MRIFKSSILGSAVALLVACGDTAEKNSHSAHSDTDVPSKASTHEPLVKKMIADFEKPLSEDFVKTNVVATRIAHNEKANNALKIDFSSKELASSLSIKPETPFDWSQLGNFNLAVDIANPSNVSVQLYFIVKDISGWPHRRSVSIPAKSSNTYYAELKGPQIDFDSGLREDPSAFKTDAKKMFWMVGRKNLQLDKITEITFKTDIMNQDKSLIIDNLRLTELPEKNTEYLTGISDKFGQSAKFDYPTKVRSDEHLKQLADEELTQLAKQGAMADRSQYGGWKSGPKLTATGYFRTEKVNGKWAIVDPEGHLFFSSGLANIRIANTTTVTGVDFKDDAVRYVDPDDVTPEDSIGIRPVSAESQKTRYIASELRHKMFEWLPSYDDELANHYSYRRKVHKGPVEHGETYSFYQANLERRYGETYQDSYLDSWEDVTIKRFKNWGFTSTGNWVDPEFYHKNQYAYFANGWIIGEFNTISSGSDVWHAFPDPFDPEFERRAKITTKVIADEVKGNPWCIGVFVDNEKSWGNPSTLRGRYGIALHTMTRKDQESPTKAEFTRLLKEKHQTITALNKAWNTNIANWQAVSDGVKISDLNDAVVADLSMLSSAFANKYFQIVHDALEDVLPNHMYMGVRMAHWGMTPEAIEAAKQYVDVMSYNFYKEGLHEKAWQFLADVDKPSIIGEYHVGATSDTGLYHPGLIHAADQQDRARMYKEYMATVIDNPYMVGAHWFQYIDSPITGRAFDGENYNVGFVTIADVPYQEMVEAAKEVNSSLYQRRFGE